MERLLSVTLRELLPTNVRKAIIEISQFFRDLCSLWIQLNDIVRLEKNISEIICKLEKYFPPTFFDVMEHLAVHFPYEVKVSGLIQYKCMYLFER